MAWSYRRRVKVIPGVYLNFSKRGISTTIGVRGASLNFGKKGTYLNTGIPGTGFYNRTRIDNTVRHSNPASPENTLRNLPISPLPVELPPSPLEAIGPVEKFISKDAPEIISQDLIGIKQAIITARKQKLELADDIIKTERALKNTKIKLIWSYVFLLGLLWKGLRLRLKNDIQSQKEAIEELKNEEQNSFVNLEIDFDDELEPKYLAVVNAFTKLMSSNKIWDITQSYEQNRIATRSSASTIVTRKELRFSNRAIEEIKSERPVFCFHNLNGAQMHFYPYFIVLNNGTLDYGFVDYKDLSIDFKFTQFVETSPVPSDATVVGKTWAKVNKDGSPDRRFTSNYQIPLVMYGELLLESKSGLKECYQFSNYTATLEFGAALNSYKAAINSLQ